MFKKFCYFLILTFCIGNLSGMELAVFSGSSEDHSSLASSSGIASPALQRLVERHSQEEELVVSLIKAISREGVIKEVIGPRMLNAYAQGAVHWAESLKESHCYEALQAELTSLVDADDEEIAAASIGKRGDFGGVSSLRYDAFLSTIKANLFAKFKDALLTSENFNDVITRARQILKFGGDKIWACLVLEALWQVAIVDCSGNTRNLRKLILAIELNDTGIYDSWIEEFFKAGMISRELINCVEYNTTALISAATFCTVKIVRLLVNFGAHVNGVNRELETPLMMAAFLNKVDVLNFLIQHKANAGARDRKGFTALYLAVSNASFEAAEALILSDNHILDIIESLPEGELANPLQIAIRSCDPALVRLLLDAGATPNTFYGEVPTLYFAIVLCGVQQSDNVPGRKENTPSYNNSLEIVRLLIANTNLDVTLTTTSGATVLQAAESYYLPEDVKAALSRKLAAK